MSRRDRERRAARRPPSRPPKRRILVVCDGRATEPQYLDGFKRWVRNPLVEMETTPRLGGCRAVVEHALKLRTDAERRARAEGDDNLCYDEIWCATDVDDIAPSIVDEAARRASVEGIGFALSNPCVELWLLLHFRDSPGARHRDEVARQLAGFVAGYDKHVDFARFQGGYAEAVRRAWRLEQEAEVLGEPRRNPGTGFHRLTESIRGETPIPA